MRHSGKLKKILLAILIIPIVVVGFIYIVMSLWNWLIPDLFNGPYLNFWQAGGLLLLSKILFGGFKGGSDKHHKGGCGPGRGWKNRFKEMSPEEREAFKEKWRNKWNCPTKSNDMAENIKPVE